MTDQPKSPWYHKMRLAIETEVRDARVDTRTAGEIDYTHTAHPYYRCSTLRQVDGDWLRRQEEQTTRWHVHHPDWNLAPALIDAGVSAHDGFNAKRGRLAEFLAEIREGIVPPGDALLAEDWHRISRDHPLDVETLCSQIWDAGCGIWIMRGDTLFSRETIRRDPMLMFQRQIGTMSAHGENAFRIDRIVAALKGRRERFLATGYKPKHTCPAWVYWDDGEYYPHEDRVAAIRLIYQLYVSGTGIERIVQLLNQDPNIWRPKEHYKNRQGGWSKPYVAKILKWRAAIGEHRFTDTVDGEVQLGPPIPGYYPRAVDDDLFNRAQSVRSNKASTRGHAGGANGSIANIFGHITLCGRCRSTMAAPNKGASHYLQCNVAKRGLGCSKTAIRYEPLERLLLHFINVDVRAVLTDEATAAREQARLSHRRQALHGELGQIDNAIESLMESIERTKDVHVKVPLEERLGKQRMRRLELEQELQTLGTEIRTDSVERAVEQINDIEGLVKRMEEASGTEEGHAIRRRLRANLHQLLAEVVVKPGKRRSWITLAFRDSTEPISLMLDAKCGLRWASDGTLIYHLDGQGNVVDVAPDRDEDTAEHTRRVNRIVAETLKARGLNPNMGGTA